MHPLEKFRYCPACGSKKFVENDEKSKRCESCGFVYYSNPSAAVAAFVVNSKGELLVETRSCEPAKGMLDLPGGFCDRDETAVEAIAREIKEETGLTLIKAKPLFTVPNVYFFSGMHINTLDQFFLCEVKEDDPLQPADDCAECNWVPIDEIHTEQFGHRSIRHGLRIFLADNKTE